MPANVKKKIYPVRHWLLLLCLTMVTAIAAQQRDFYGNQLGQDMCRTMSYTPDEQVNQLVNRIVDAFGFGSSYILEPCTSVHNCLAIVDKTGKPYILYNPTFLTRVKGLGFTQTDMPTASDWNVLHVLAHEVAHHLRNHLTNPHPDKTQRDLELEADETAGYILYLLGAPSLAIAQKALEGSDVPESGSYTHPPRAQRLVSFRTGWDKAQARFPRATPAPSPTPVSVNPTPVPSPGNSATYTDALAGNFMLIEGGSFDMGCTSEQKNYKNDEKPVHRVTLNTYYIGQYEVTQAQWRAVMGNNPSYNSGCNQCPVERVSWDDVQKFLLRLNARTGQNYRLPTEAEWEFAARGGSKSQGHQYAGSYYIVDVAWYSDNSGNKTNPVGQKQPNELGLYDMSGNAWEWCQDWFGDYSSSAQTNPIGPLTGSKRVFRGGSYNGFPEHCRVAYRGSTYPDMNPPNFGFRLARTP